MKRKKKIKKMLEEVTEVSEPVVIEEDVAKETETDIEPSSEENPHTLEEDREIRDQLIGEIGVLREKERVLTDKLSVAKERGLNEHADRLRVLLQRVVIHRNGLQKELAEVEARIRRAEALIFMENFGKEVDELSDEIDHDLLGPAIDVTEPECAPFEEEENRYKARAKRLSVCSTAFLWIGLFGGLMGALIYLLMVQLGIAEFAWMGVYAFGGLLAGLLLIALILGAISNHNKKRARKLAQTIAEKRAEYEADCAERERLLEESRRISQVEDADAIAEAYSIERAGDGRLEAKRAIQSLIPDLSDAESMKKKVRGAAAITAITTLAVLLFTKKSNKKKGSRSSDYMEDWF